MGRGVILRALATVGLGILIPAIAAAQSFGFRAGVSGEPDQFFLGVHVDSGPIADHTYFRPNVELGVGQDLTLVALNVEFVYRRPLRSSRWSVFAGGGPAANVFVSERGSGRSRDSDVRGGLNALVGMSHRQGFFAEMKVGFMDSPSVKLGLGVTFGR